MKWYNKAKYLICHIWSYSVLREEDALALSSTISATVSTTLPDGQTASNQTNRVPLAVGLTLGLLAIVAIVFGGIYHLYRRRSRAPIDPISPTVPSPYGDPPMTQADQQTSLLQIGKHHRQSTRSSGAPVTTSGRTMDSVTEPGPPPSYVA